jgi:uncharacterized membrane protein (DUF2068 family)
MRCSWGWKALVSCDAPGRWFTIGATISLIPLERYEIIREVRPMRVVILGLNTAVVIDLFTRKDVLGDVLRAPLDQTRFGD